MKQNQRMLKSENSGSSFWFWYLDYKMEAATLFSFHISEMGATVGVTMWYQFSSLQSLSHV